MPNADPTGQDAAVLLAVLTGVAALGLVAGWWLARQPRSRQWRWALGALAVALLPVAGLALSQLLRSDALGWMAGLSLMVFLPLGAPFALGAALGWAIGWLAGRTRMGKAATPGDARALASKPTPRPSRLPDDRQEHADSTVSMASLSPRSPDSLGAQLAVVGVGAGFVLMIAAGFRISGGPAPAGLDHALWPAAAVLAAVIAWFVRVMVPRWRGHAVRRRAAERWTGDGIAADLDPQALACCEHLQPVERALRRAVPGVEQQAERHVYAPCQLDVSALRRKYTLADCVRYEEPVYRDRQGDDEPGSQLRCIACQCTIRAVHARVAREDTPVFPGLA
jgi:hypothetical protein